MMVYVNIRILNIQVIVFLILILNDSQAASKVSLQNNSIQSSSKNENSQERIDGDYSIDNMSSVEEQIQ